MENTPTLFAVNACSTPDGAGETFTDCWCHPLPCHAECSTPDGVGETFTNGSYVALAEILECSTPDGVGETFTGREDADMTSCPSAQRLTASGRRSLEDG